MDNRSGKPSWGPSSLLRISSIVRILLAFSVVVFLLVTLSGCFNPEELVSSQPTQTRLEELSKSLLSASTSIGEIQMEIDKTKKLVDELEQKKNLYEQLVSTNREQVEAIVLMLAQRQEQEQRKALWISIGLGFVVNMITAVIALYLEYRVGFFRRWLGPRPA